MGSCVLKSAVEAEAAARAVVPRGVAPDEEREAAPPAAVQRELRPLVVVSRWMADAVIDVTVLDNCIFRPHSAVIMYVAGRPKAERIRKIKRMHRIGEAEPGCGSHI